MSQDGSLVLVTGASGFIATHTIRELLKRGYRVRGTVRSHSKGNNLKTLFKNENFDYVIVADIEQEDGFDEAVKGVSAIIHTASPLPQYESRGGVYETFINPAIRGTLGILKSAVKNGPDVKRIVITSSYGASCREELKPGTLFTEADWNDRAVEQVKAKGDKIDPTTGYQASKVLAERAAWEFVATQNTSFDLVTILPSIVGGPIINMDVAALDYSNGQLFAYLTGKDGVTPKTAVDGPPDPSVDVRDVAYAHVEAISRPAAGGKRIGVTEGHHFWQEYLDLLKTSDSQLAASFPNAVFGEMGAKKEGAIAYGYDTSLSKEVLGIRYRPFSETVVDAARSLVELAEVKGWKM